MIDHFLLIVSLLQYGMEMRNKKKAFLVFGTGMGNEEKISPLLGRERESQKLSRCMGQEREIPPKKSRCLGTGKACIPFGKKIRNRNSRSCREQYKVYSLHYAVCSV